MILVNEEKNKRIYFIVVIYDLIEYRRRENIKDK